MTGDVKYDVDLNKLHRVGKIWELLVEMFCAVTGCKPPIGDDVRGQEFQTDNLDSELPASLRDERVNYA
jgi:hypothetical protein